MAGAVLHDGEGGHLGHRLFVGAARRQGVVDVGDAAYLAEASDVVVLQILGIPCSVDLLVMLEDDLRDLLGEAS